MSGVIAATALLAATAPLAASPAGPQAAPIVNCADLGGIGVITVTTGGMAKGRCSFPGGFPDLGLPNPADLGHAVHIPCVDLAKALSIQLVSTPTGQATLTPSNIISVNCRNVFVAN